MPNKFNKLESEVLSLPESERALLASHLLSSLEECDIDPELEKVWAAEAEARYQQYIEGVVESEPAHLVMERARAVLKNGN